MSPKAEYELYTAHRVCASRCISSFCVSHFLLERTVKARTVYFARGWNCKDATVQNTRAEKKAAWITRSLLQRKTRAFNAYPSSFSIYRSC